MASWFRRTRQDERATDERRPLLQDNEDAQRPKPTPLPTSAHLSLSEDPSRGYPLIRITPLAEQVFILCLMRFGEPIAFSLIFPFVSQFIEELGVTDDPRKIGYYAGIIVRAHSLRLLRNCADIKSRRNRSSPLPPSQQCLLGAVFPIG